MFENTLAAVTDLGLSHLHVFPYSERQGTPAAKMPTVAVSLRKERAAQLRAAGDAGLLAYLKGAIGTTTEVLVEQGATGFTPHYASLRLDSACPENRIIAARVTGIDGTQLLGTAF